MDDVDVRIMRELAQGRHEGLAWGEIDPSYREIARNIGVSRETVRDRVEKMSSTGFLRVFPVQVNPSLLGLKMGALSIDVPQTVQKAELVKQLSLVEGMVLVVTHISGMLGLSFYYEDDNALEKKISLIVGISGGKLWQFTVQQIPPCNVALSPKDWQVVSALQHRRKRSPGKIAGELGMSVRTLRRRTKRMIDGMAISTLVSSGERAMSGGVIGNLQVEYSSAGMRPDAERTLLRELDSHLIFAGLWASFSLFTLVLPSIPASSEVLEKVRRAEGVSRARLDLIEERVELYSALTECVDRKLKSITANAM